MTKKEIKYIESDLDGILRTSSTVLNLARQMQKQGVSTEEVEIYIKTIEERLLYLHKHYNLTKK